MDNDEGFLQRNFVGLLGRLRISVSQLLSGEKLRRYKLDTSEVKSGLLHVDDPVNTGIPSEPRGKLRGGKVCGVFPRVRLPCWRLKVGGLRSVGTLSSKIYKFSVQQEMQQPGG